MNEAKLTEILLGCVVHAELKIDGKVAHRIPYTGFPITFPPVQVGGHAYLHFLDEEGEELFWKYVGEVVGNDTVSIPAPKLI